MIRYLLLYFAFQNPGAYSSVSAFAPICNPTQVPWGVKAFTGYLGSVEAGKEYDATELVAKYKGPQVPILIDQVCKKVNCNLGARCCN